MRGVSVQVEGVERVWLVSWGEKAATAEKMLRRMTDEGGNRKTAMRELLTSKGLDVGGEGEAAYLFQFAFRKPGECQEWVVSSRGVEEQREAVELLRAA